MVTAPLRVGVVVLNWNGREHLNDCLSSVLANDHSDFFVLVVDNASTDGSVEWMREHFPEVEVLVLPGNLRFAGGNNAGAKKALELGAELVLLLNNDTRMDPACLSRLEGVFRDHPTVAVAGPRICYFDDPGRIWYGGGYLRKSLGWVSHRALRRKITDRADPPGPTGWVSGCSLAVRGSLWQRLGGLDESYYIYAEDVDFCLRADALGAEIWYEPRALVLHKVSASVGGTVSAFKAYHKTRAGLQLFLRHTSGLQKVCALLGRIFYDGATAALLLVRGHPRAAAAVVEAWVDTVAGRTGFPVGDESSS